MSDLVSTAPNLRRPVVRWPKAANLKARYEDFEQSYGNRSDSIVEHCKAFVETVSITLINEFGGEVPNNANLTDYVKAAREVLGIEGTPGGSQISAVLRALNRMTDALNALRNQEGVVAHGKDGYLTAMAANYQRMYVLTADSVVGFLLDAYEGKEPSLRHTRDPHDRFGHLNSRINSGVLVESGVDEEDGSVLLTFILSGEHDPFTLRISPSQILFDLDREAYLEVLKALDDAVLGVTPDDVAEEADDAEVVIKKEDDKQAEEQIPASPLADAMAEPEERIGDLGEYKGQFAGLIHPMYSFLYDDLSLKSYLSAEDTLHLTHNLLWGFDQQASPDWEKHENATARIRALFKKTFRARGVPPAVVPDATHKSVDWLKRRLEAVE